MATGPASWGFLEGDLLTAELTAVRRLGGGSAYEAWLAFDEITYGPVVAKLVRPNQVRDPHTLRGLGREADALASIRHPVVVRPLRHEPGGECPHLVLEQVDGPRLSTLVRRYGPLPEQQYLPLALELASALHYLAGSGWTHLDLKPSNVVMGAPARLIDLSIARRADEAAALDVRIGTDAYLAPEQCVPGEYGVPSPASDVWGLGMTLFEAVAGRRPFEGVCAGEHAGLCPRLARPAGPLPARTPAEVAAVLRACLEVDPANRPAPREVAEALEPVLERQPPARLAG